MALPKPVYDPNGVPELQLGHRETNLELYAWLKDHIGQPWNRGRSFAFKFDSHREATLMVSRFRYVIESKFGNDKADVNQRLDTIWITIK